MAAQYPLDFASWLLLQSTGMLDRWGESEMMVEKLGLDVELG